MSETPKTPDTTAEPSPAALRATARHLYESTLLSMAAVGAEVGVSERTVKRWAAADASADAPWRKLSGPQITERAHEVADKITTAVAQLGPEASHSEHQAVVAKLTEEAAVDERAALLENHRRAWRVVEGLTSEAIRKRDAAGAKLAETVAKTIAIKQRGERLAWGLDAGEGQHTVIIERT